MSLKPNTVDQNSPHDCKVRKSASDDVPFVLQYLLKQRQKSTKKEQGKLGFEETITIIPKLLAFLPFNLHPIFHRVTRVLSTGERVSYLEKPIYQQQRVHVQSSEINRKFYSLRTSPPPAVLTNAGNQQEHLSRHVGNSALCGQGTALQINFYG